MRKEIIERKIAELNDEYRKYIRSYQFAKADKARKKIEKLRDEITPHNLGDMLEDYSIEFKKEMLTKMHKLFIYADLLESAALDFQSELESNGMSAQVISQTKKALKELRGIVRIPDEEKNQSLSDNFGAMCDEANLVVSNIINKYLAK